MTDSMAIGPEDVAEVSLEAPTLTAEVHCGSCDEATTFQYPADFEGPSIIFEHPCGTKGVFVNPKAKALVDPETDDVVWDSSTGEYVQRVASSEAGSSADIAS